MSRKIYITSEDHQKLVEIMNEEIKRTLENQRYAQDLLKELEKCEIVDPEEISDKVITMNSKVSFRFSDSDKTLVYTLVFPQEADISKGKISILSPIGTALIGYQEGDVIKWSVPSGEKQIKVEKIIYQPESEKK